MKKKQYLAALGFGILFGMGVSYFGNDLDCSYAYAQDSILTEAPEVEKVMGLEITVSQGAVTVTSEAVTAAPEVTQTPVTEAPEETKEPEVTQTPEAATEAAVQSVCMFVLDAQGGMMYGSNKQDEILLYKKDVKGNTIIDLTAIEAQRRNYLFKGWYTEPDGGTKVTRLKITTDTTLYAKWKKVTVKKAKISKVQNKTGRKATVKLKKTKGAKGYQIVYSTKRSFKNAKKKNTTKRTVTLSKLKKKKTYYVKVRAYKKDSTGKKVFGAYSSVKKVKVRR